MATLSPTHQSRGLTYFDTISAAYSATISLKKTTIGLIVLAGVTVSMRIFVRARMTRQFGWGDWTMVITFALALTQAIISVIQCTQAEKAFRTFILPPEVYYQLLHANIACYVFCLMMLKISLGFFFLNIFGHKKKQRYFVYFVMGFSTLVAIIYFPFGAFTCARLKGFPADPEVTSCPESVQTANTVTLLIFTITKILGDFAFSTLGVVALWKASLPRGTKLSASALIILGDSGAVVTAARLIVQFAIGASSDNLVHTVALTKLLILELVIGIMAANLALTRPLWHALLVKLGVSSDALYGPSQSATGMAQSKGGATKKTCNDNSDENPHGVPLGEVKKEVTIVIDEEAQTNPWPEPGPYSSAYNPVPR